MKNKYRFFIAAFLVFLLIGCKSGTYHEVQKYLLSEEHLGNSTYDVCMEFTLLESMEFQEGILSMVMELLESKNLFNPHKAKYFIVIKLIEFKKIPEEARFLYGIYAGTDVVKSEVVVVKMETLKSEKFKELQKQIQISYRDKEMDSMNKMAKPLFSMEEAHLIKTTLVTEDRSPLGISELDLCRKHSEALVKFIVGK